MKVRLVGQNFDTPLPRVHEGKPGQFFATATFAAFDAGWDGKTPFKVRYLVLPSGTEGFTTVMPPLEAEEPK